MAPLPLSPAETEAEDGVRAFSTENSPRPTHLPPAANHSPNNNQPPFISLKPVPPLNSNSNHNSHSLNHSSTTPTTGNSHGFHNKPTHKNTISIIPLNETLRMERIIDDVLDAVNLSELDDMLRSTDWLRSLLQTLDDMPISVSIALFSTNENKNNSGKYSLQNKNIMRSKRGLFGRSNSHASKKHSSKTNEKTGQYGEEEPHSVTATSLSTTGKNHANPASVVPFDEDDQSSGVNDISTANFSMRHPLIYVNRAFEKMTKYHRDEVIGHSCSILEDPILTEKSQLRKLEYALSSFCCAKIGLTNVKQDGSLFFNLVSMKPLVYNRSSKDKYHNRHFTGDSLPQKEEKYCKYIISIQYALGDGETPAYNEMMAIDDLLRLLSNFLY